MAKRKESKKDYLKRCRNRVAAAKTFREREGLDDLWRKLIDMYRGKHFPESINKEEDRIAINLAFANINSIWASITNNYPKITVNAAQPEDNDLSVIVEALINYWWRTKNVKPEVQRAAKDSLILGFGWLKTGYRFVEEEAPIDDRTYQEELEAQLAVADEFAMENPDLAGAVPTDDEIAASLPETKMVVVEDAPFVERLSPFDVFVDPEATSLRDARWVAQRVMKDIEDVQSDERYNRSVRNSIKSPEFYTAKEYLPPGTNEKDSDFQRVCVWEYYDLKKRTMCVFANEGDGFLIDPTPQPYTFGHPFVMIRNYEVPDQFYPMGELEAIKPLQDELNKTRSQLMNHRKQNAQKWLVREDAFEKSGLDAITSDTHNAIARVKSNVPLNEAIAAVPTPSGVNAELYRESAEIKQDINAISGVTEFMRGGGGDIRKTATQVAVEQDAANARAADKLAQYEIVNADVARRMIMLASQYLTTEEVVRITGKNGAPVWATIEPDWIEGEFYFEVEAGSTRPQNESFKRERAMQMLQMLGPWAGPEGSGAPVKADELAREVLIEFGVKDPDRFLNEPVGMMNPLSGGPMGMSPEEMAMSGFAPEAPAEEGEPIGSEAQLAGQVGLNLG